MITTLRHLLPQKSISNGNEVALRPFQFVLDFSRPGSAVGNKQVQLIMFVLTNQEVDDMSYHLAQRVRGSETVYKLVESSHRIRNVSASYFDEQSILVGKVLIQRANGDPGFSSDPVRGCTQIASFVENASCSVHDPVNRPLRPRL
jgi:hypothetical protein